MSACDYIKGTVVLAPYNEYWHILRRLSLSELMVQNRIESSAQLRQKCIDKMIQWIKKDASEFCEIQLDEYLMLMTFNLVSNFMLTRDITDYAAVEEDDLTELTYLQAVVDETMRLHPALPLLLPRIAREDTKFMGYDIPKGTTVIVNAWSIHRDPESWEDPLSFKPERFLNSNINHKGQHYEMIPFGSGRRSCVGMLMGEKTISLTLARLIQSFDWGLPANISPETLDMSETTGLSLRMSTPLKAFPRERGT